MQSKVLIVFFVSASFFVTVSADDCFDYGIDFFGFDLDDGHYNSQGSPELCQKECQATDGCEFWTWDPGKHSELFWEFWGDKCLGLKTTSCGVFLFVHDC